MSEYVSPPPDDTTELSETDWPASSATEPPESPSAHHTKSPSHAVAQTTHESSRRMPLALGIAIVVLTGVAGWALYAMQTNEHRALSWQHRAQRLETNTKQLKALLAVRTRLLNQRIDQLNALSRKLKTSQAELGQSQSDVASLETRQRELANEKAQLQDQQRMLDEVAGAYVTCKADLIQLFSDIANSYDTTSSYGTANADCANADDTLQSYLGAYPNG
jgi:uncharacterized protein HemX